MIESGAFDKDVILGMKDGANLMKQMNKEMNVDDIADLKDEMDDMMAEQNERQDYFAQIAQDGNDELLGELDELEALAAEDEMNQLNLGPQAAIIPNRQPAVAQEEDEEAQLKAMMMM